MIEAAAEVRQTDLMEKYLETGELSIEEIKRGLRKRTITNQIVPVLCGSVPLKIKACKHCWMQ